MPVGYDMGSAVIMSTQLKLEEMPQIEEKRFLLYSLEFLSRYGSYWIRAGSLIDGDKYMMRSLDSI
jgi:hypothetical protein